MVIFGSMAYVLELCGNYFSCFLFIKLVVDLIVKVLIQMETHRLTGGSLSFGRTLMSASYNLYLPSILMSVSNPQAPLLQPLEPELPPARIEDEARDPVDEKHKKEEHLYPVVHHRTTTLSPV